MYVIRRGNAESYMKQNYLYKCVDCQTVKAVSEDYGEQTWGTLSCKACGDVVTQHRQLVVVKTEFGLDKREYDARVFCLKEKEDDLAK